MGRPVPSERAEVVFCPGLEGANSLIHLTGPAGWSHKGLPVVTWLSRGRFAVAQGGGKAESKCHVF